MVKIGLEIHGYLNTNEKLFCNCKAIHGAKVSKPNSNICPTCTGQPGSKPMLPNKNAVDKTILIALILGCKINKKLIWQRKHYDWADLPKGFQSTISGPYAIPVGEKGKFLDINITEAHLEEDPAAWNPQTGEIDYNRSGSPLIEIVTEPDFKTSDQVVEWLKQLIITLNYVKAVDKDLGIKADVNVSTGGARIEVKNVNSLSNIKATIEHEIQRQKEDKPTKVETRMFSETKGITIKMRDKEDAQDYRFISEPDLPIIKIDSKRIEKLKKSLPETPHKKVEKLIKKHKIEKKYAETLTKKLDIAEFFEKVVERADAKLAVHWVAGELTRVLNYSKKELEDVEIDPEHFIELLNLIENNVITALRAKDILNQFVPTSFSPKKETKKHVKIDSSDEIEKICDKVIKENQKAVEDYKSGKKESINFLIGQVMKQSQKRADFKTAKEILEKKLT